MNKRSTGCECFIWVVTAGPWRDSWTVNGKVMITVLSYGLYFSPPSPILPLRQVGLGSNFSKIFPHFFSSCPLFHVTASKYMDKEKDSASGEPGEPPGTGAPARQSVVTSCPVDVSHCESRLLLWLQRLPGT